MVGRCCELPGSLIMKFQHDHWQPHHIRSDLSAWMTSEQKSFLESYLHSILVEWGKIVCNENCTRSDVTMQAMKLQSFKSESLAKSSTTFQVELGSDASAGLRTTFLFKKLKTHDLGIQLLTSEYDSDSSKSLLSRAQLPIANYFCSAGRSRASGVDGSFRTFYPGEWRHWLALPGRQTPVSTTHFQINLMCCHFVGMHYYTIHWILYQSHPVTVQRTKYFCSWVRDSVFPYLDCISTTLIQLSYWICGLPRLFPTAISPHVSRLQRYRPVVIRGTKRATSYIVSRSYWSSWSLPWRAV